MVEFDCNTARFELYYVLYVFILYLCIKVLRRGFTLGGARFGRHLLKFLRL